MDKLDLGKIAQSGVDPVTGFPLSKEVRKELFKRATVSSSVFDSGGALAIRPQNDIVNKKKDQLILQNTATNNSLQEQILSLKKEVFVLRSGLVAISNLLQNEGIEEKNRLLQEQELERRSEESKIRITKENKLEQVIQSAVLAPVQAITPKVQNIFSRVGDAISTLFLGWLGSQGLKAIKAYSEGDTEKLNQIKNSVLKNIGMVLGGFIAIKAGFSLVANAVKSITFKLISLIAKGFGLPFRAFSALGRGFNGKLKIPRLNIPGSGGGIGKALGFLSKLAAPVNIVRSVSRFSQGDIAGGFLSAGSAIPGPVGLGFFGVDVARDYGAFEGTFLGKNERSKSSNTPPSPPITPKPTDQKKPPTLNQPPQQLNSQRFLSPPPAATPQTPSVPETTPLNLNVNNQNQFSSNMDLLSKFPFMMNQSSENMNNYGKQMEIKPLNEKNQSEKLNPEYISAPLKSPTQISEMPNAKPNIVYRRIGEEKPKQSAPSSSGPLTDVPLIKSSNPSNFYSVYSQLQYNVVV